MSTSTVFRNYSQSALDREYDNRGKVTDFEYYIKHYPELSQQVRTELPCRCDVAYGSSSAETLDIFMPSSGLTQPAPIQVFYHGGYWRSLHKDDFSYVAYAFQPRDIITVVVNYALVPGVSMDELVRQCRAALAWTWQNAASFGGDPDRLYISGHSAGGHLVAMMMATDWPAFTPGLSNDVIKGGCGISGLYDLEPIQLCFLNQDLQLTQEEAQRNSPVQLPCHSSGSLLLPLGADEGPEYLRQSQDLASAWSANTPVVTTMPGLHHFSIVAQLAQADSDLSRMIQQQMGLT